MKLTTDCIDPSSFFSPTVIPQNKNKKRKQVSTRRVSFGWSFFLGVAESDALVARHKKVFGPNDAASFLSLSNATTPLSDTS